MSNTNKVFTSLIRNVKDRDTDPISPLIDEYMLKRDKSKNRFWGLPADIKDRPRPLGRLSPSSLCGCPRQAAFKFLGTKGRKFIDPDAEVTFDDGKWRHLRLGWQLLDMQAVLGEDKFRVIAIEEDVSYPGLFIAGSFDAAVAVYGIPILIDFKGINHLGFEWLHIRQEPKQAHVRQVITYGKMRRIKNCAIWYENKNNGNTMIFMVKYTPELFADVKMWSKDVLNDIERERLPLRANDCKHGQYNFGRCPYAGLCYGDKTDAQIERMVYKDFTNKQDYWQRGMKIVEAAK